MSIPLCPEAYPMLGRFKHLREDSAVVNVGAGEHDEAGFAPGHNQSVPVGRKDTGRGISDRA